MIDRMLDMPWRPVNALRRLAAYPYIRLMFTLNGVRWGKGWHIFGMPILQRHRKSTFQLGDGLELRSWQSSNPLAPNHPVSLATRTPDAILRVGRSCGLTGATLVAAERIEIGDRVLIGANSTVMDTDFHPLTRSARDVDILAGAHAPIIIEDDVFIGMNCIILKGVTIGHDSVIGAGSVVTRDVPPYSVAVGSPVHVVRRLDI